MLIERPRVLKLLQRKVEWGLVLVKLLMTLQINPPFTMKLHQRKRLYKEDLNVAEERFLLDHKKCIQAQKATMNTFYLDMVLPVQDSISTAEYMESEQAKDDLDSPHCYPEPEELLMSELSDWLEALTRWISPPHSPSRWVS